MPLTYQIFIFIFNETGGNSKTVHVQHIWLLVFPIKSAQVHRIINFLFVFQVILVLCALYKKPEEEDTDVVKGPRHIKSFGYEILINLFFDFTTELMFFRTTPAWTLFLHVHSQRLAISADSYSTTSADVFEAEAQEQHVNDQNVYFNNSLGWRC